MNVKERLSQLGLTLPEAPKPVAAYVPAVRNGDRVYVSGQLPFKDGELIAKGRVGEGLSLEEAKEGARVAALNGLAAASTVVNLNYVNRVIKLTGYVASGPDFFEQPQVINGASELIQDIFGEAGRHARAAVGVSALPLGAAVEVEMILQVIAADDL